MQKNLWQVEVKYNSNAIVTYDLKTESNSFLKECTKSAELQQEDYQRIKAIYFIGLELTDSIEAHCNDIIHLYTLFHYYWSRLQRGAFLAIIKTFSFSIEQIITKVNNFYFHVYTEEYDLEAIGKEVAESILSVTTKEELEESMLAVYIDFERFAIDWLQDNAYTYVDAYGYYCIG